MPTDIQQCPVGWGWGLGKTTLASIPPQTPHTYPSPGQCPLNLDTKGFLLGPRQRCLLPYLCWEPQMNSLELAVTRWGHCVGHKATSVPNPHVTYTPCPPHLDHHQLCCLLCAYEMPWHPGSRREATEEGLDVPHLGAELLLKVMQKWAFPFQSGHFWL